MALSGVNEHELERALRRGQRTKLIVLVAAIVAIAAYPFVKVFTRWHEIDKHKEAAHEEALREEAAREAYANRPLTAEETERLRNIAPKLVESVRTFQDEWRAATSPDALADVTTFAQRACPIPVASPSFEVGDRYVKNGYGGYERGMLEFAEVSEGNPIPGPNFDEMLANANEIAKRVAAGSLARKDFEAANALYAPEEPVKFLIATAEQRPVAMGDTYSPGRIAGTAYIYDLALGAIVCAGEIDVESSPGINVEYLTDGTLPDLDAARAVGEALDRDLAVRAQRAIAKALRATTAAR